jgi:mono/diheme cytochrome c family protein
MMERSRGQTSSVDNVSHSGGRRRGKPNSALGNSNQSFPSGGKLIQSNPNLHRRRRRNTMALLAIAAGIAGIVGACQASSSARPRPIESAPTPTSAATPTTEGVLQGTGPDQAELGRRVYLRVCAACHGEQAEGYAADQAAPALDSSEHASHHPDQQIHEWIVGGRLGLGGQMPASGDQLSDGEVHAIIAYLHTLWTPEQLRDQQDLGRRWPATPEPTWTPAP